MAPLNSDLNIRPYSPVSRITVQSGKLCSADAYPVNDASSMEVFDTTQHLVEQVGQPLVVQLHLNDLAQVRIHQLHHQVSDRAETEALKRSYKRKRCSQQRALEK